MSHRPAGVRHAAPSRPLVKAGFHPPQQARSRAALQRLLASAEHVLINDGPEELTIARVAEHAGVSVGGVYRRFAGKDQLIDAVKQALAERLEHSVAAALESAEPSLEGVVDGLATALSETLNESARLIPAILAGGRTADPRRKGCESSPACGSDFSTPQPPTVTRSGTPTRTSRWKWRFAM